MPNNRQLKNKIFGTRVTFILSSGRLLTNENIFMWHKILTDFIIFILLTLNFLILTSETIDIKNCYDLPCFATHMNPICYHLIGVLKWLFGIVKVNDVEILMGRLKYCHELSLTIHQNDGMNIEIKN